VLQFDHRDGNVRAEAKSCAFADPVEIRIELLPVFVLIVLMIYMRFIHIHYCIIFPPPTTGEEKARKGMRPKHAEKP